MKARHALVRGVEYSRVGAPGHDTTESPALLGRAGKGGQRGRIGGFVPITMERSAGLPGSLVTSRSTGRTPNGVGGAACDPWRTLGTEGGV